MQELVQHLRDAGVLHTSHLVAAFGAVDRKDFVPSEYQDAAYEDYPLPIGHGQTISQPYTVAFMLELLEPQAGEKILDVGCGSGWTTALLAHIVGAKGQVFGTEIVPELVERGKQNIAQYRFAHVRILQAGKTLGMSHEAPFDRILVSAAANELPQELVAQLKLGGILVIPVRDEVWQVRKTSDTKTATRRFSGFAFVPLVE